MSLQNRRDRRAVSPRKLLSVYQGSLDEKHFEWLVEDNADWEDREERLTQDILSRYGDEELGEEEEVDWPVEYPSFY